MKRLKASTAMIILGLFVTIAAQSATTIIRVKGDVRIRRGLEEAWSDAQIGDALQDLDTILCEEGQVVIELPDGSRFTMGSFSILDIGDLRRISRQEMFLFIMSQKVQKIPPRKNSRLREENISSVHGERQAFKSTTQPETMPKWRLEFNAARAMYDQNYFTNSVIKLHKIFDRYSKIKDCGRVSLYLGKSFEALEETGQAIDNYQTALHAGETCRDEQVITQARSAIRRLSE